MNLPIILTFGAALLAVGMLALAFAGPSAGKAKTRRLSSVKDRHAASTEAVVAADRLVRATGIDLVALLHRAGVPGVASPRVRAVCALADGLATALMVLGPKDGLELVTGIEGCQAYLVDKGLQVAHSRGFFSEDEDHNAQQGARSAPGGDAGGRDSPR